MLQNWLGKVDVKIVELSANIEAFHLHMNTITNALDSYGLAHPELVLNFFKAYLQIDDLEFKTYVLYMQF
jgi:hypothetical protein